MTGLGGESWAEVLHGERFCSNEKCELYVRREDTGVCGSGEWAVRSDGIVTSRAMYAGRMLCDVCGRSSGRPYCGGES